MEDKELKKWLNKPSDAEFYEDIANGALALLIGLPLGIILAIIIKSN